MKIKISSIKVFVLSLGKYYYTQGGTGSGLSTVNSALHTLTDRRSSQCQVRNRYANYKTKIWSNAVQAKVPIKIVHSTLRCSCYKSYRTE